MGIVKRLEAARALQPLASEHSTVENVFLPINHGESIFSFIKVLIMKKDKSNCVSSFKATDVLRAIEDSANNIRKILLELKADSQRAWSGLDDAVVLAASIEQIASKSVNMPAADANASVELLEIIFEQFNQKVSRILAS